MAEQEQETLEMDEVLEKVLFFCLDEAKQKKTELGDFAPFTVIVEGDNMHIETYPGDDADSIRENAKAQVKTASSFATHYAYCYDGFLDAEDAETGKPAVLDCIIVECAQRDMDEAYAIVLVYEEDGDTLTFGEEPAYAGPAEFFFEKDGVDVAEKLEFEAAQAKLSE